MRPDQTLSRLRTLPERPSRCDRDFVLEGAAVNCSVLDARVQ